MKRWASKCSWDSICVWITTARNYNCRSSLPSYLAVVCCFFSLKLVFKYLKHQSLPFYTWFLLESVSHRAVGWSERYVSLDMLNQSCVLLEKWLAMILWLLAWIRYFFLNLSFLKFKNFQGTSQSFLTSLQKPSSFCFLSKAVPSSPSADINMKSNRKHLINNWNSYWWCESVCTRRTWGCPAEGMVMPGVLLSRW